MQISRWRTFDDRVMRRMRRTPLILICNQLGAKFEQSTRTRGKGCMNDDVV